MLSAAAKKMPQSWVSNTHTKQKLRHETHIPQTLLSTPSPGLRSDALRASLLCEPPLLTVSGPVDHGANASVCFS